MKDTFCTLPFFTSALALISPAGASSVTSVTGSFIGTIPVSIMAVTAPIVPCPHMLRYPPPSMKMIPKSASLLVGATKIEPNISLCPLGSSITAVLM